MFIGSYWASDTTGQRSRICFVTRKIWFNYKEKQISLSDKKGKSARSDNWNFRFGIFGKVFWLLLPRSTSLWISLLLVTTRSAVIQFEPVLARGVVRLSRMKNSFYQLELTPAIPWLSQRGKRIQCSRVMHQSLGVPTVIAKVTWPKRYAGENCADSVISPEFENGRSVSAENSLS